MQEDNLKVATLTANYNNGKYFTEWLSGILCQTRKPNASVIVDDGSKDDSVETIIKVLTESNASPVDAKHFEDHSEFRTILNGIQFVVFAMKNNGGPAVARNVGLKRLVDKVDVVCIADSDDIFYTQKIKKSIDILLKYPQVALVYSDYDTFDERNNTTKREFKEPYSYKRLFQECIVSNNSAIATSVIKVVGLYDESIFGPEDYDLWLRIAEVASVYHIPEPLYKYRLSGNNITITTPSEKFASHVRKVHQKAIDRLNKRNNHA